MSHTLADALRAAMELVETVRRLRDVESPAAKIDAMAGGFRWRVRANALGGQLEAAEQVIQPLLGDIQRLNVDTIDCGHLSAPTGFELALALGRHASGRLRDLVVRPEATDSPMTVGMHHVEFAFRVFAAIPMPDLREWNHLLARLEQETRLLALQEPDGNANKATGDDGPLDGNRFRFGGEVRSLAHIPWRLIDAMWGKDSRDANEVTDEIWEVATGDELKSAMRDANKFLANIGYPQKLSKATRTDTIVWKKTSGEKCL
ncbi:MAG: hypothetical protein WD049_09820 [Candidatus Paceibacterota bacterium]